MFRISCLLSAFAIAVSFTTSIAQGQRTGNPRLFGTIPAVTLAQLEEVQVATKLSDDQEKKVASLQDALNNQRRELFQDAAGDFEKIGQGINRLYAESQRELDGTLQESQRKRMQEVYIQVNGSMALMDKPIQEMLEISDKQRSKLQAALGESRRAMFESFQDYQNMSDEERAKAGNDLVESRNNGLLAVLSDTQKAEFKKSQGENLTIDLSKLPIPGRR